jgi:DnaK suppressor protein
MDEDRARSLLQAERGEVQRALAATAGAANQDRTASQDIGDAADHAQGFEAEAVDDTVAAGLRERLAAIDRAEQRLAAGTYGRSVRSGEPIPDERLEANPAAELTVEEAEAN